MNIQVISKLGLALFITVALSGCSGLGALAVEADDNAIGCFKADVGTVWNPFAAKGSYTRLEIPEGMKLTVEQFIELEDAFCGGLSKEEIALLLEQIAGG